MAKDISNREFLGAGFEHMLRGEFTAVTSFHGDPYTVPFHAWSAKPWQAGMSVPGSIMGRPQNTYGTVSSFRPAADGTFHRRKDEFAQMHVVMVDDIYEKIPRRKLKLPPSAMIQTSPPSAQAFYFLAPTLETRNRVLCEGLLDALVRSGLTKDGKDPGMRGVTRLFRLPVGVNAKAKYEEPFKCQLTLWHPERRYTLAEIAKAFRLDRSASLNARSSSTYTPGTRRPRPVKLRRGEALKRVNDFEAMLKALADEGMYVSSRGPWHEIVCPWVDEHSDGKPGGSALHVPAEGNSWLGGYRCWHGHCEGRTVGDVYRFAQALVRGAA